MLLHIADDNEMMKIVNWFWGNKVPSEWKYEMTLDATWIMNLNLKTLNRIQIPILIQIQ